MNEEIKIHKDQSTIEDYLKEENEKCLKCRWIYGGELICVCPSSEYRNKDVSFENVKDCDQYYPHDEMELMSEDSVDGGLFDE